MKIEVQPGRYVLAVSGGVDSMVLLDLLASQPKVELVIAHFDHGIREKSAADAEFVRREAARRGLPFESTREDLGAGTSEESARLARYEFLFRIQKKYHADALITAHHQDDLIETAFINILRGSGRKGLVAIKKNSKVYRPLLSYSKRDILRYAKTHEIRWREDQTNKNENYLRNYVRKYVMSGLNDSQRGKIVKNIDKVAKTDNNIDRLIANLSQYIIKNQRINRSSFSSLPVNLGEELVAFWLRQNNVRQFDRKTVNRLCVALKTGQPNTIYPVQGNFKLVVGRQTAHFG